MRILYYGYAANNHSWGSVAQNFSRQFKKMGHQVDIFSTNGLKHLPADLSENIIGHHPDNDFDPNHISGKLPEKNYDMSFSFTMMRNFRKHLQYSETNKFGIWCYEWENYFPPGLVKYEEFADIILPCSEHAKKVFLDAKVPEEKLKVLPYGVGKEFYQFNNLDLNTKKTKYLTVMASTDGRKNIEGLFAAWSQAFTNKDNVIWIIKIPKTAKIQKEFYSILNSYKKSNKNMAEIRVMSEFIDNMQDLFFASDIYFSLSKAESFLIPALESVLAGKPVIASNHGGALDFLNENNSWLVDGKMLVAPQHEVYYAEGHCTARWFEPSIKDAVKKLRQSAIDYKDKTEHMKQFHDRYKQKYDWANLSLDFLGYCK